ncbi:hypothetical protein EVAR_88838_1 [Eumeta japonica]|uniref:Uncharacterized protein n=1 Tax=Eumeta variegata TaxID=151549 RepID=A0A4C1Y6Y6_EUMVA|nr:hypothetical protein EVAR_88838_1 [Eumeta japonica]
MRIPASSDTRACSLRRTVNVTFLSLSVTVRLLPGRGRCARAPAGAPLRYFENVFGENSRTPFIFKRRLTITNRTNYICAKGEIRLRSYPGAALSPAGARRRGSADDLGIGAEDAGCDKLSDLFAFSK